jgi:cyclohexadienyl dehydratase
LLALLSTLGAACHRNAPLDGLRARGFIRVGTTGDYRPFSYLRPETGAHEGFDIEAALALGKALGVEVRFVPTTWPTLLEDAERDRFDIAMSGITRTPDRLARASLSEPYLAIGKAPLIRRSDRERFRSLADIDRPGVKIGVNPGGTNEAFARASLRRADLVMFERNLTIPEAIASGQVDAMLTDNVEAMVVASERPELYAVSPDAPLTREELAYLVAGENPPLLKRVDEWVREMKASGAFDALYAKWIRRPR